MSGGEGFRSYEEQRDIYDAWVKAGRPRGFIPPQSAPPRRSLKARVIGALWRTFRPGSAGQKVVRAIVYTVIIITIIAACSLVAITL